MGVPLTLIRLGGVYCPEPLCSSSSGLARAVDDACQQGDAAQSARADDVACPQGDAPHLARDSNVIRTLLRGVLSSQRAVDERLQAPDVGHGTHLAAAQEKRLANNGQPYTRSEFPDWYGDAGERQLEEATQQEVAAGRPAAEGDAA